VIKTGCTCFYFQFKVYLLNKFTMPVSAKKDMYLANTMAQLNEMSELPQKLQKVSPKA